jgi:hypothetical protein
MSSLAIASILEELRCMDGELFKAEICQRLFLWLKSQACESLETLFTKSAQEYAKALEVYRSWPSEVAKEELLTFQEKAGGAEELQSAWVSVSMHWVRLNKKADAGKTSVKIKTPDPRDLLKNFFVSLCSKSWCIKGDLWSMDPVKQDFVFREVFRTSVGSSVHFLQEDREYKEPKVEPKVEVKQEVKETKTEKEEVKEEVKEKAEVKPESPKQVQTTDQKPEKLPEISQEPEVKELEKPAEKEEEEDDIGPDDSVSHFFGSSRIGDGDATPRFPALPVAPKRYADAGTVMYSAAPKRVLVKPITLKLENPIQSIKEEES